MKSENEKTVASISFHNNKNLSIDIEEVGGIDIGNPQELGGGLWFVDVIIRSENGNVSLQLTADNLDKLKAIKQEQVD